MRRTSGISQELAEAIAQRLRVIGDPTRIRLLDSMREEQCSVGELAERLGTSQQNASKHLGVLLHAGIVSRRKEGTISRYEIADPSVFALCEEMCGALQDRVDRLSALVGERR